MPSISILDQLIDDEDGMYRVRYGDRVVYLTIFTNVFDEDTMCQPSLLIPALPAFPDEEWTRMKIVRPSADAPLEITITNDPLPEVETAWHEQRIDVLSLKQIKRYRSTIHEVIYNGRPAISKIASFDFQIPGIERETWAYSILDEYQSQEVDKPQIGPRVLGHLTESGRVIGILLERLEGDCASLDDLPACTNVLRRMHDVGLIHGDVNRYNFMVDRQSGSVKMVDFEHAAASDEASVKEELDLLEAQLAEDGRRGAPLIWDCHS